MEWDAFWQVIGDAYRPDPIGHVQALADRLGELKWFEVIEFQAKFEAAVAAADVPELRGAASLINGDSEPGFRDFRVWLVGRGRDVYDRALADPDSLADVLSGDPVDAFGLDAAALRAYEAKTGMSDFPARLAAAWGHTLPASADADWDVANEGEVRRRFPRLSRLYPVPDPADDEGDV